MEARPTWLLAIVLVLGASVVASLQNRSTGVAPAATVRAQVNPGPAEENALLAKDLSLRCQAVPDSILPLCRALEPHAATPDTRPWLNRDWISAARTQTRVLIATVPDPEQTRLTLYTDRTIDSLQRAAESAGYTYDSHWLPWKGPEKKAGDPPSPHTEPGVLFFRPGKASGNLLIFLVGESPVSGVRRTAVLRAVGYARALSQDPVLRVAGPSYSGALASMKAALDEAQRLDGGNTPLSVEVISGTVTVKAAIEAFGNPSPGGPQIRFQPVMQNDSYVAERFRQFLEGRWGEGIRRAFLSESQTVYGKREAPQDPTSEAKTRELEIRFPREISRLRNVYPEAKAREVITVTGPQSPAQPQVELTIRDTHGGQESIAPFSQEQLPVAQEAILLDIAATLREERVHLAGLAATDVFDALFLTSFLRRAAPDVRLYVDDVDMLYVRGAPQLRLDGILALTTYPLMTRNQVWSTGQREGQVAERSPVGSRFELGAYNAARTLLLRQLGATQPELAEHVLPAAGYKDRPPLWLVTVGINGYWPVALLDGKERDLLQLQSASAATDNAVLDPGKPTRLWLILFWVLVAAGMVFGSLCMGAQAGILPESMLDGHLHVAVGQRGATGRAYFISAQCIAVGALLLPMAGPVWALYDYANAAPWIRTATIASAFSFTWLMLGAVCPYLRLGATAFGEPEGRAQRLKRLAMDPYFVLGMLTLAAFFSVALIWRMLLQHGEHLTTFFFALRSFDLLNGVSPIAPFMVLGLGLLLMARLHARRHWLYLQMPKELPLLGHDARAEDLRRDASRVARSLGQPIFSDSTLGFFLIVPVLLVFLMLPTGPMESLEGHNYDAAYQIMLRALFLFAAATWARFLIVWRKLRPMLENLDRHPIREVFSILPSGYTQLPLFEGRGRLNSKKHLSRALEELQALLRERMGSDLKQRLQRQHKSLEEQVAACLYLRNASEEKAWDCISGTGSSLALCLQEHWGRGSAAFENKANGVEAPRAIRIAEEIVALPFLAFLSNTLLQLRNLLVYVTLAYFLGVMSGLVYPFRSHDAFFWAVITGFLVLGLPVAFVIVQMDRDPMLRRLTQDGPQRTSFALLRRLAAFGALPLIAVLSSYFPGIGRYLIVLLEPALQGL